MILAAAGAVAVAATVGVVLFAFGGSSSVPETIRDAGCTLQNVPAMMKNGQPWQEHVGEGSPIKKYPKRFKYSTFPPTSGPHLPIPAAWAVYDQPVNQQILVHNLEHGGLVIQYGNEVPRSDLDALLDWYRKDPNAIVIAPLPALRDKIAMAAWSATSNLQAGKVSNQRGHLATCGGFDAKAFDAFGNAYAFRGPEYHPRNVQTPNTTG